MRLLTRIALIWIVLGLLTGLILRTRKGISLAWLAALSLTPWLVHTLYLLMTVGSSLPSNQLLTFLAINLLLAIIGLIFAWRYLKNRSPVLAVLPLAHGILYSLLLYWFNRIVQLDGLGLNSIPWIVYGSAVLFMTSLMFSFLFRVARPKLGSFSLKRFRK